MEKNLKQDQVLNANLDHISPIVEPIEIPVDDSKSIIRITELPPDWQKVILSF